MAQPQSRLSSFALTRSGRRRFLGLGTAGLAAALAACGNRSMGRSTSGASGPAAAQPQQGGVLRVRTTKDFFDFDTSGGGKSTPNDNATTLAYDTLVTFRRDAGLSYTDMQVVPRLAQSWESPDAQTFTFHLRPGVKWANLAPVNGRPLTAADVKWTLEYASRTGAFAGNKKLPPASFGFLLEGMTGVEAPDDHTVVVKFEQPYAPFINFSFDRALQIVPHEIYDQDGNFSNRMAGTGPFQLDANASQHGSKWVFRKNPDYWQSGKPYVNEIDYLVVPDDPSAYAAFQAGQLDILQAVIDPKEAAVLQKALPQAGVQQYATPSAHGIFLNLAKPPFNDARMRKAASLAVDRDAFDKTFGAGKGQWPALCALPDWQSQSEVHQLMPYDPQQAKQMLAAAGYPNGLTVEYTDKTPQWSGEIQLLQAQLKQIGVTMTIKAADAAASFTALHSGTFTLFPTANGIEGDMDYLLFENFYSKSTGDLTGAKDPQLDTMLLGQRRETDAAKRLGLLKDISRYMTTNNLQINLYYPESFTFWAARVKGYADHWQQSDVNATDVWLQQA